MKIIAIIPIRLASTRFPNKPLYTINGISMIQTVYQNVLKSNVNDVYIATSDDLIVAEVKKFGGKFIKTSADHINGTSRIIEAIEQVDADYILNVQGDEPLLTSKSINKLLKAINPLDQVYSLYSFLKIDVDNPNIVKLVTTYDDYALYFSRSKIPYPREKTLIYKKHVGVYLYSNVFLKNFKALNFSNLEFSESLEQLKILENGFKIKMVHTSENLIGVDTISDIENVRRILNEKN